jgi:hypothetical protein
MFFKFGLTGAKYPVAFCRRTKFYILSILSILFELTRKLQSGSNLTRKRPIRQASKGGSSRAAFSLVD